MGEMVEHISVCESSHSNHHDFDRFKGCVKQQKNVHSNQTGLKERQMLSAHTHTHTYVYAHWCFAVIAVITEARTHTHTYIYIYTRVYT